MLKTSFLELRIVSNNITIIRNVYVYIYIYSTRKFECIHVREKNTYLLSLNHILNVDNR